MILWELSFSLSVKIEEQIKLNFKNSNFPSKINSESLLVYDKVMIEKTVDLCTDNGYTLHNIKHI